MPADPVKKAKELIEIGKAFTYDNFSTKDGNGYPSAQTPEYVAWKTQVESFIASTFGRSSPAYETFKRGDSIPLLGWGADHFMEQHSTIIGTLLAGIDTVEFQPQDWQADQVDLVANNKVFVVHGHDEQIKTQLEIFLTELGLEPIVLHRKADEGLTVIEKFEKHSDVGYAFILLTPDDIGYPVSQESRSDTERRKEARARQNVIFEFGYFLAKLGRQRVCCLYKEGVTLPTDVSGILYKKVQNAVEEVAFSILKDLKAAGYKVSL